MQVDWGSRAGGFCVASPLMLPIRYIQDLIEMFVRMHLLTSTGKTPKMDNTYI